MTRLGIPGDYIEPAGHPEQEVGDLVRLGASLFQAIAAARAANGSAEIMGLCSGSAIGNPLSTEITATAIRLVDGQPLPRSWEVPDAASAWEFLALQLASTIELLGYCLAELEGALQELELCATDALVALVALCAWRHQAQPEAG